MMSAIFSLETVYVLTGLVLLAFSVGTFADAGNPRRIGSGCLDRKSTRLNSSHRT